MTPSIAVVDTNVVVSGLLTAQPDAPTARILDGMLSGRFSFLLSLDLLAEYRAVLMRPPIRNKHGLTERDIDVVLTEITANGQVRDIESGLLSRGDGDEHLRRLLGELAHAVLVTGDTALRNRLPSGRAVSPKAFADLVLPIEVYSPGRKAEFLLTSAVDEKDYAAAKREVERMGLKPTRIRHKRPPKR